MYDTKYQNMIAHNELIKRQAGNDKSFADRAVPTGVAHDISKNNKGSGDEPGRHECTARNGHDRLTQVAAY